ncbi:MAG: IS5 family transposase [Chlamydiae bacterium]|nr:IS5 family transposase [Chlamydiota bacterium]
MKNHAKRDWREYNKKLTNHGSLTFWFDPECLKDWIEKDGKRGRPSFSESVIQLGLIIRTVYKLPLRALQGFLESILRLIKVDLHSPHYSLFSKRAAKSLISLPKLSNTKPVEIAIDSSGIKVAGEGEWKVKIHGADKRRSWIKVHIGVDTQTQDLVAAIVTNEKVADSTILPKIVETSAKSVRRVLADGAYDATKCREFLHGRGIQDCIPPRRNGKVKGTPEAKERDFALEVGGLIGGDKEGIKLWKSISGYHMRSLVETAFSRLKRLFGDKVSSKKFENISSEIIFRCYILNRMNRA